MGGNRPTIGGEVEDLPTAPRARPEATPTRSSCSAERQVTLAFRSANAGTPDADTSRKLEITATAFYRYKRNHGGLGITELRRLRQIHETTTRFAPLVHELPVPPDWSLPGSRGAHTRMLLARGGVLEASGRCPDCA